MKRIHLFTFSLFILSVTNVMADNWSAISKAEFRKVLQECNKVVTSTPSFTVDVSYCSYEKEVVEIIHDRMNGYMHKNNENLSSSLLGIYTLQDNNKRIVVDRKNKIMAIALPQNMDMAQVYNELNNDLLDKASYILKQQINGSNQYKIQFGKEMPVSLYIVEIDKKNCIRTVDIAYNRNVKADNGPERNLNVRIAFENWNLNPSFNKDEFNMDKYIVLSGKKYTTASGYGDYTLYDQRVELTTK